MKSAPANIETVIRPNRGWLELGFGDLWQYRDLLLIFVYRDFAAKYKQTVLGPAWFALQPLLMTAVFTIIFGHVAKIPTDGLPPVLFYLSGLLAWSYLSQTFQTISNTLIANAGLFGKVYFPRLIIPLAAVVSNFLAFTLQLIIFICLWLWFKFLMPSTSFALSSAFVFFPLLLIQLAALSLGAGLWMASLTAKYRDFSHLSTFLVQLWMYATPVIYPFSEVPQSWRWIAALNPMTMPVEMLRYMMLAQGTVDSGYVALSIGETVVILLSGALFFSRVERTFVDTV